MTNLTEAKLAREAEICYGVIALSTDYDCWHDTHEDVSIEAVLAIIRNNVATARNIIRQTVKRLNEERSCPCARALKYAIISDKGIIPVKTRENLALIIGKYLD
jgi:5'-methylthioadenosine phosphorylase